MTSNELKHEARKQEWSMSIQECRGSGLSVSEWCRQRGVKQVSCNVAERCATLHIGNASLDIYPGCDAELLKMLVELLRLC